MENIFVSTITLRSILRVEHEFVCQRSQNDPGQHTFTLLNGARIIQELQGWIISILLSKILAASKVIQLINLFGKALSELSFFKVFICHHFLWPFLITDVVMHNVLSRHPVFRESARSFQENKQFVHLLTKSRFPSKGS